MRQDYLEFVVRDAEILSIGPESREGFAQYWQREDLPFVGLADPDHIVARMFGQRFNLLKLGRMPAIVVVDRAGKIRYRHHGDSMSDIPPNQEILDLLDRLNREKPVGSPFAPPL